MSHVIKLQQLKNGILIIACFLLPNIISLGQATWTNQESNTSALLTDVYFIDSDTGWVVGADGTILATYNSGELWIPQSSPVTSKLNSIFFINSNHGWIVGNNGTLLYTSNKGAAWVKREIGISEAIYDIFFINDSVGWLSSDANPSIYKTVDWGNNWNPSAEGRPGSTTIYFISKDTGWTAMGPSINKTTNGGIHWNGTILNEANIHSLYFVDENYGYSVGSPFCAFKTTNGGSNWESMDIQNCLWLNDVFFINRNIGCAAGDGIFQTTDGGSNWEKTYFCCISSYYAKRLGSGGKRHHFISILMD